MDIFNIISLSGGLAFFLYGMHVMSSGLTKVTGGKLERTLKKMTSNPFKSLVLGAGITIAIQSSSALTVMLVGLVNSGIMQLGQTVGIIMGSNIGTTLTAWILSLTGIESSNFFLKMLKPTNFSPLVALAGVIIIMGSKRSRRKDIGSIMVGFSVLMYGMHLMSEAVSPLADMPEFASLLVAFKNPILGVVVGAVFTGIIQSSAASVGILQALSLTGTISFGMAIPVIMGQNIGTCVTAILSSIGVNRSAKRVAAVHISFNLIGTIICLILFYGFHGIFHFSFFDTPISIVGIAICHSAFNIFTTLILMPFPKQLEKLAMIMVKDDASEDTYAFLDERLLQSPSFAINECENLVVKMSDIARENVLRAIDLLYNYKQDQFDVIEDYEDILDKSEDKLGSFLVKIAAKDLSDFDSLQVGMLLHGIGDLERIGDHAINISEVAKELNDKQIIFSSAANEEIEILIAAVKEILDMTMLAYKDKDQKLALRVEPLEEVIDVMIVEIKQRHVDRLQKGQCNLEYGFVHADLLNNCERISDHCSNLAIAVLNVSLGKYDAHEYTEMVKSGSNPEFEETFKEFSSKYALDVQSN
ncbi:MAG: Na/Pi cotransporter family protein [Clostridia bacterium]|nr:Na/Pi cotransporter family protein [Clostridia bacterium]